jgi:hypothetical protein
MSRSSGYESASFAIARHRRDPARRAFRIECLDVTHGSASNERADLWRLLSWLRRAIGICARAQASGALLRVTSRSIRITIPRRPRLAPSSRSRSRDSRLPGYAERAQSACGLRERVHHLEALREKRYGGGGGGGWWWGASAFVDEIGRRERPQADRVQRNRIRVHAAARSSSFHAGRVRGDWGKGESEREERGGNQASGHDAILRRPLHAGEQPRSKCLNAPTPVMRVYAVPSVNAIG